MRILAALVALVLTAAPSLAQNYPSKSVRVVVGFAAGGPTDVIARIVAQKLSDTLGQQFYVENIGGAGGNTASGQVARAPADGYTVMVISTGFMVNPSLYAKVPYDPIKDFAPVTLVAASPNVVVVNPSVPAKTIPELVQLIRDNPGKYSFAGPGVGSTPHLSGELFRLHFNLDLVHVPFTGAGPAIQATLGGHTPIAFTAMPPAMAAVKDGKLRALGVAAQKRVAALPDLPTFAEQGDQGSGGRHAHRHRGAGRHAEGDRRPAAARGREDRRAAGREGEARARSASCRSPTRRTRSARASGWKSRSGARWCATPS